MSTPPPGSHPDAEVLAALALDPRLAGSGRAHVATCPRCTAEVTQLRGAAATARRPVHAAVPPHLWARVEGQLRRQAQDGAEEPPARRRRLRVALAVVALVAVTGVGWWWAASGEGGGDVARVTLAPLEAGGSGTAVLARRDGGLELRLDLAGVDAGDGYLELWLRDGATDGMVSLGPAPHAGLHPLPPGLDPADYPVVEVSIEPLDGDPRHGGRSVLRGTLPV